MRARKYVEDRGTADASKQAALKWTLFPAMGAILMTGVAIENGDLFGSRESRLHRLFYNDGHAQLLEKSEYLTISLQPTRDDVARRAALRLDAESVVECSLHDGGDITTLIMDPKSSTTGKPWVPGDEFRKPLDALCGSMISAIIENEEPL